MPKLIFNNQVVTIGFSAAVQNQTTPTYTDVTVSAATTTCNVKSLSISRTVNQIDLASVCSTAEESFNTRTTGQIDIEVYLNQLDFSGYVFQNRIGFYCRITFTPTGMTTQTYQGVVTNISSGVEIDGAITEKATIKLGVA